MPFGLLVWRLAPVLPCLGRGKRDIRNCDAIGRIARFRVASEVTEQNYLIDGCHSVLSVCGGLLDHEKLLHALDRHALFDNFDRPATQIAHADAVTRADLRAAYFILKCAAPDAFDNSVAVDVHEALCLRGVGGDAASVAARRTVGNLALKCLAKQAHLPRQAIVQPALRSRAARCARPLAPEDRRRHPAFAWPKGVRGRSPHGAEARLAISIT